MPFFAHPRDEVDLSPTPLSIEIQNGPKKRNITAGEYLEERLRELKLS